VALENNIKPHKSHTRLYSDIQCQKPNLRSSCKSADNDYRAACYGTWKLRQTYRNQTVHPIASNGIYISFHNVVNVVKPWADACDCICAERQPFHLSELLVHDLAPKSTHQRICNNSWSYIYIYIYKSACVLWMQLCTICLISLKLGMQI